MQTIINSVINTCTFIKCRCLKYLKKAFYILYALSFVVVFFVFLSLYVTDNTISLTGHFKQLFTTLSPQGWGFFTRNPTDKNVDIYLIKDQKLTLLSVPNGSVSNYFGFSRKSRKIGMEISIILGKIASEKWDTVYSKSAQLHVSQVAHHISPSYLFYLSKGDYLLVKKDITPWAWYGSKYNFIPYETMHVQIK